VYIYTARLSGFSIQLLLVSCQILQHGSLLFGKNPKESDDSTRPLCALPGILRQYIIHSSTEVSMSVVPYFAWSLRSTWAQFWVYNLEGIPMNRSDQSQELYIKISDGWLFPSSHYGRVGQSLLM